MSDNLTQVVQYVTEEILLKQIEWNHAFGTTKRKYGEIVVGNPRDTVDSGMTITSLEVNETEKGVTITFPGDSASFIFDARKEVGDYIVEELLDKYALRILDYLFKKQQ